MTTEEWQRVSRVLDYIMQQPTKPIKESPGVTSIKGETEKPRRPKKEKKEVMVEQLRMF